MNHISVIFEDPYLLILNKPSSLHSVSTPKSKTTSLANLLLNSFPQLSSVSPKPEDGGLVQRLDNMTSGVILAAKSSEHWQALYNMLKAGSIRKKYICLLEGQIEAKKEISCYLGSPYRRARKVRVYQTSSNQARRLPSHSIFQKCAYFKDTDSGLALVTCGAARRHQIRAHAGFMGHPLVGDKLYGAKKSILQIFSNLQDQAKENLPEFFLHALEIEFIHPVTNKQVYCRAPLPWWCKDWERFVTSLPQ